MDKSVANLFLHRVHTLVERAMSAMTIRIRREESRDEIADRDNRNFFLPKITLDGPRLSSASRFLSPCHVGAKKYRSEFERVDVILMLTIHIGATISLVLTTRRQAMKFLLIIIYRCVSMRTSLTNRVIWSVTRTDDNIYYTSVVNDIIIN